MDEKDCLTQHDSQAASDQPPDRMAPLIDDAAVAKILCMAPATIRVQRFRRRSALPHWLTVDPIYIGSRPRYRQQDIAGWLETCSGSSDVR